MPDKDRVDKIDAASKGIKEPEIIPYVFKYD